MEKWKKNLYIIWISQILSLMSFSFGMPFIPFYIQELGITQPDAVKIYVGILSTAPAITMAVMAPVWGIIADKRGKKLMLLRAMLTATFIISGMGIVTNVNQLIVLRLLQGVFTGTVTAAAALVAAGTPPAKMSYALGFMTSAAFIGTSIGPVIGGFLAEYTGYRVSFYIGGILMLIDFFLVLWLVNENTEVKIEEIKDTQNCSIVDKKRWITLFTPLAISLFFALFIIRVTRSVFNPYMPLFVQEMLSGGSGAAKITGIINGVTGLMTALSGFLLGRLGDKRDKIAFLKLLFAFGILASIPLFFSGSLTIFTILYGVFFFIIGSSEPVIVSLNLENTPRERHGALFGIQSLVGSIGWAISPALGGFVSINFSNSAILLLIPIILIPGFLSLFITGKIYRREQAKATAT